MIIKEIELRNIRSHKDSLISFGKGITVLSGRTGCGKSTFLMSVAFSLFGADVNLTNTSILRRGVKTGFVRLVFSNGVSDFEVMRGLKRSGERIIADPDNLWIKEDGKLLPIISRSEEINEKILEFLKYPLDVKPKELFEITCYSKQDEVRKLIELTSMEREKFIDRILQLSKYELTYENLRSLVSKLSNDLFLLKGRLEGLNGLERNVSIKKKELFELNDSLKSVNLELFKSNESLSSVKNEYEVLRSRVSVLEFKKASYENKKGLLDGLVSELARLVKEVSESSVPKECVLEPLIEEHAKALQEKKQSLVKIEELKDELVKIKSLKGSCPLCMQLVSNDYAMNVSNELLKLINVEEVKCKDLSVLIDGLKSRIVKERELKLLIDSLRVKTERVNDLRVKIAVLEKEVIELNVFVNELVLLKDKFSKISDCYLRESSVNNVLFEKKRNIDYGLVRVKRELSELSGEIDLLNKSRDDSLILERKVSLLNRLREDIRSIRTVVRSRFLEDFRHEFQKKYEDIRQDDSYSVDINSDYAPLAYSEGEEVSIDALSGGERTSVALAYRLALSEIAAQVSSIEHSELLMLDEPTTGFDRRDITVLPETLRAIKRIPQIIIVTHEDELKEAADVKYEIVKINGNSELRKI